MTYLLIVLLVLTIASAMAEYAEAGAPPQPRAVPPDGKIAITDYGYRDWGPELVHYTVDPNVFRPGDAVLRDEAGGEVPCQIDGNVLSFVATLGKGKTASYTLAKGKAAASSLLVKEAGEVLEIANEFFTVRVPAPGKKTYQQPAASHVPAPLLGWRPAGGSWMGGSRFVTDRAVSAMAAAVLRNGRPALNTRHATSSCRRANKSAASQ